MDKQKIRSIENTISMLMRLDENSLILIENNAETLKKYLDLKKRKEKGGKESNEWAYRNSAIRNWF